MQRSFRLSARTVELLDAEAETAGESRNALADRLLGEALRMERHPLIRFHQGAAGRRRPLVTGTRLYVHQVIGTLHAGEGDVDEAAAYLGLTARQVRAALDYYADFRDDGRRRLRRCPSGRRRRTGAMASASSEPWREAGARPSLLAADRRSAPQTTLRRRRRRRTGLGTRRRRTPPRPLRQARIGRSSPTTCPTSRSSPAAGPSRAATTPA